MIVVERLDIGIIKSVNEKYLIFDLIIRIRNQLIMKIEI